MSQISKLKQLITKDTKGNEIKRNFNNIRTDIKDDELRLTANAFNSLLNNETANTIKLTANSSLAIK